MRKRFDGRGMVITGASSGLGEALAVEAAARGARLVVAARRKERLEQLASRIGDQAEVHVVPVDLNREADAARLVDVANDLLDGIDFLVLNAGVVSHGTVADTPMEVARQLMEVNYFAPLASIRRALPGMKHRPGSHIVVVSSYCAYAHMPLAGGYSASKAAVASLARVLATETPPPPDVTVVYPGVLRTEMFDRVQASVPMMRKFAKSGMDPEVAARKVLRAIARRNHTLVLTRPARVMDGLMRIAPTTVDKTTRAIFRRIPLRLLGPGFDTHRT